MKRTRKIDGELFAYVGTYANQWVAREEADRSAEYVGKRHYRIIRKGRDFEVWSSVKKVW